MPVRVRLCSCTLEVFTRQSNRSSASRGFSHAPRHDRAEIVSHQLRYLSKHSSMFRAWPRAKSSNYTTFQILISSTSIQGLDILTACKSEWISSDSSHQDASLLQEALNYTLHSLISHLMDSTFMRTTVVDSITNQVNAGI